LCKGLSVKRERASSRLELRIPPKLKEAGEKAATERGLTLAALLRELLAKYLKRHHRLEDEADD
jgi:hypothetical protein